MSKSYLHRALICAALCKEKSTLYMEDRCEDVQATLLSLNHLCTEITCAQNVCTVSGFKEIKEKKICANSSGATLRFLLPLLFYLGGGQAYFSEQLAVRPMKELLNTLKKHGMQGQFDEMPYTVYGEVEQGDFCLSGDTSSQFVSGLLLCAPCFKEDVHIQLTSPLQSKNYVHMTMEVMRAWGVNVEEKETSYHVKKGQTYKAQNAYKAEGDWTSALNFVALGLMCGEITISGVLENSTQGDCKLLPFLIQNGANIFWKNRVLHVQKSTLSPFEISVQECIDSAPILAICMLMIKGTSKITHVKRLKYKESNRILSILNTVQSLGEKAVYDNEKDEILIFGRGQIQGGKVHTFSDHRIAMAAGVAGAVSQKGVEIVDAQCVEKSYPNYFEQLHAMGGNVTWLPCLETE